MRVLCCICRDWATMIVYDKGWWKPSCLTCWPKIDIPKNAGNLPLSGELVYL